MDLAAECDYPCHNHIRGSYNDAWLNGSWDEATQLAYHDDINRPIPVRADDPLEAAVACEECQWRHVAALG